MHATTGNWRRGFALALTTAVFWGILPIALKHLLNGMDAITVTWYRLTTAGLALAVYLTWRRKLPTLPALRSRAAALCVIATVGLAGNYVLYLFALDLTTPTVAQIIGQVSPLFLLAGGLLVFGERLSPLQWLGMVALVAGLAIFFHDRLGELASFNSRLALGGATMIAGSMVWATYALAQKQLLTHYSSAQVLFMIYIGSIPLLLPWSHVSQLAQLDLAQLALLAFCCLNTLVAYGSFAEALDHWQVSRIGAVVALSPLLTIAFVHLLAALWPAHFAAEPLTAVNVLGACLVVAGSITCALGAAADEPTGAMPEISPDATQPAADA